MNFKRLICVLLCLCFIIPMNILTLAKQEKTSISDIVNNRPKTFAFASKSKDLDVQKIKEQICNAIDRYQTIITLSSYRLSEDELVEILLEIIDFYPEYFYLDLENSGWYMSANNVYVTKLFLSYLYTNDVCNAQRAELKKAVDKIVLKMNGITEDEDKIIFLHDYICAHNSYDEDGTKGDVDAVDDYSFTAYGCLVNNVSVCQGMTDAFILVCKKIGLTSYIVMSEPMVHAWNLVKAKDSYYHLDITWDDSAIQAGLYYDGVNFLDVKGFASHDYFMKSDNEFKTLDHYSWSTYNYALDSETYKDYYWDGVYSQIFFINGNQYYIKDSKLIERNSKTGEETVLYTIDNGKFYQGEKTYTWYSKNAVLAYNYEHDYLLMNLNDGVYAYNLNTRNIEKVYEYVGDGYISGIFYEGNTLSFDTAQFVYDNKYNAMKLVEGESASTEITFGDIVMDYCDVDGNGLSVTDILMYRKYLVKEIEDINFVIADANNDNNVNVKDLLLAIKKLANC